MPIGIGTGLAIAGGVAAVGGVASAVIGSNAAKKASRAQMSAADRAAAEKAEMFEKAVGYLDPYAELGKSTLPTIRGLLGLDGGADGEGGITQLLEKYPGYKFALEQGQKLVGNQAQAAGARYSGNALKAASDYGQQTGYGVFSDYFNNVMGVTGMGQNAATGIANASVGHGTALADIEIGKGNAQARGIMGQAQAWGHGIGAVTDGIGSIVGGMTKPGGLFGSSGGGGGGVGSWNVGDTGFWPTTRYR